MINELIDEDEYLAKLQLLVGEEERVKEEVQEISYSDTLFFNLTGSSGPPMFWKINVT